MKDKQKLLIYFGGFVPLLFWLNISSEVSLMLPSYQNILMLTYFLILGGSLLSKLDKKVQVLSLGIQFFILYELLLNEEALIIMVLALLVNLGFNIHAIFKKLEIKDWYSTLYVSICTLALIYNGITLI